MFQLIWLLHGVLAFAYISWFFTFSVFHVMFCFRFSRIHHRAPPGRHGSGFHLGVHSGTIVAALTDHHF